MLREWEVSSGQVRTPALWTREEHDAPAEAQLGDQGLTSKVHGPQLEANSEERFFLLFV